MLNGGLAQDALVVSLPESVELDTPLYVLHLTSGEPALLCAAHAGPETASWLASIILTEQAGLCTHPTPCP